MNQKIDWMIGMSENMLNLTMKNKDKTMMEELYSMTSAVMGNFNHMKMLIIDDHHADMMEPMMRNMEATMTEIDMNNETQKMMMKHMMGYLLMMQMNAIMMSMRSK